MNINYGVECIVCKSKINLRMQAGRIEKNLIRFNCPKCGIPINIELNLNNKCSGKKIENSIENANFVDKFQEAKYSIQCSSEFFTSKNILNPFNNENVEASEEIFSPFIQASKFFGSDNLGLFANHCYLISECIYNINVFERVNNLYYSKSSYFISHINEVLEENNINITVEDTEISKFEGIYYFNIMYLSRFLKIGEFSSINKEILKDIDKLKKDNEKEFNKMVNYFGDNKKIEYYERKIIKTINSYIKKIKYLMPSIGLEYLREDITKDEIYKKYTMRTSTFEDIRNIYLEVYENFIDIYDFIASLNNIKYRGSYEKFNLLKDIEGVPNKIKKNDKLKVNNLLDFKLLDKGLKLYYVKDKCDEGFNKYMPNLESYLRNSLGHENWSYDDENQIIKFENKFSSKSNEHSLLEYANECYNMFSRLLAIYKILMDIKNSYLKNAIKSNK